MGTCQVVETSGGVEPPDRSDQQVYGFRTPLTFVATNHRGGLRPPLALGGP